MPRKTPKNTDFSGSCGAGSGGPPDTIEARIARWKATGEGETALKNEIQRLLEQQSRLISGRYSSRQIVRGATDALGDVMDRVRRRYDPGRPFAPWLKKCLTNACNTCARAARTKRARLAIPMSEGLDAIGRIATHEVVEADSESAQAQHIVHEIESRLRPPARIIFAVTVGRSFARSLGRDTMLRWCKEYAPPGESLFDSVSSIMDSPKVHGRLKELADALNLREATARQVFKRALRRIMDHTESPELRAFLALPRSERTRGPRKRGGQA